MLGLDELTETAKRLARARKGAESPIEVAKKDLVGLRTRLEGLDNERATACAAALSEKIWDLDAALALATGVTPGPGGDLERLRALCRLELPSEDEVLAAVEELGSAAQALAAVSGTEAARARSLAALLEAALTHYGLHHETDCPVCGRTGALDGNWARVAGSKVARLRCVAEAADAAHRQACRARARARARALVASVPQALIREAPAGLELTRALVAWRAWTQLLDEPGDVGLEALAEHLMASWAPLVDAVCALVAKSAALLAESEDRWAPTAAAVSAWCTSARDALTRALAIPPLKAAESWLKKATDDIRNARLAPLADEARLIWEQLRQESNVGLGALRLTGSSTQRHLQLDVVVDDSPGMALSVMSQGELNALALSIFLPRSTLAASPFRFLVIDDPVQAMDPAKVDGLARVLEMVARRRQVVVFTHDERLPAAARHLGIAARVLEVTRRPGSVVNVRLALDPVNRALADARALCADQVLPGEVAARVVAGMCRVALEAALVEAIRRRLLRAGESHVQIEVALERAATLTKRASLALFGHDNRAGEVLARLNGWGSRSADTYQALSKGAHQRHPGNLVDWWATPLRRERL